MRTVDITDLRERLNDYLECVRNGEEVVIRDDGAAIARIMPMDSRSSSGDEAELVASGTMKLPEQEMDWDEFFAIPAGNVPHDVAVEAAIESRGER